MLFASGPPADTTVASFHPCQGFTILTHVLDSPNEVNASTDIMVGNFENRHFIDRAYLVSLEGGQDILDNLTEPVPLCTKLMGSKKDQGERVLGMLHTLRVKCHFEAFKIRDNADPPQPPQSGWVELELQNVLVVEDLPVPLHISMKGLNAGCRCHIGGKWDTSLFPTEYSGHPYWNREDYHFFGTAASRLSHATGHLSSDLKPATKEKSTSEAISTDAPGAKCG
jgi:hypothetical protein